jgi:hypothetical protein
MLEEKFAEIGVLAMLMLRSSKNSVRPACAAKGRIAESRIADRNEAGPE